MNRSLLGTVICAAALLCGCRHAGADDEAGTNPGASVLVQTAALIQGTLPRTTVAFGVAAPGPAARLAVMAPIASTIAAVTVRIGERVAKGAPLVELAPTPATSAAYTAALSAAQVAADALQRERQLRTQQLVTEPQVAAAEKTESDARAALIALRAQGGGGPTILRAPDAAVVTALTATTHAIVAEGAPLVELARSAGLVLIVAVTPGDASMIKAGEAAEITPVGAGSPIAGRVRMSGAAVDPASGLVPVEVSLPPGAMLAGESAQVLITTALVHGFLVPHAAVLINDRGDPYIVQVVQGIARTVTVTVRAAADDRDIIDGPLQAGAPVVVAGTYQLQDGMKVRFSDAARPSAR